MSNIYKLIVRTSEQDELAGGVFTGMEEISLVEDPAISFNWVKFNKDVYSVEFSEDNIYNIEMSKDKMKQRLTGPVLIPNQLVSRDKGTKFVYADQETIDLAVLKLMKNGYQNNTKQEHAVSLEGNTIIELWTIQNSKNDKANELGYDLPVGTLMMTIQVGSEEYWNTQVMTGKVKGFSMGGLFGFQEVSEAPTSELKLSKEVIKKTEEEVVKPITKRKKKRINLRMSIKEKMLEVLKSIKFNADGEIQDVELAGATIQMEFDYEGQAIEMDEMFILINSDTMEIMPAGEYSVKSLDLTTNYKLDVAEEGKVLNIKTPWGIEADGGEAPAETVQQSETETTPTAPAVPATEEIKLSAQELDAKNIEIMRLQKEVEDLKKATLKGVTLSKGVDKVTAKPVDTEFSLSGFLKNRKK